MLRKLLSKLCFFCAAATLLVGIHAVASGSASKVMQNMLGAKSMQLPSAPAELRELVKQFRPIFVAPKYTNETAEQACPFNIPTKVNFDGDWNAQNNEDSYDALLQMNPDVATSPAQYREQGVNYVYYDVVATESHAFLTYYLYYPHDAGFNCAAFERGEDGKYSSGHLGDASSMMLIVRIDGDAPAIEFVVNSDHHEVTAYQRDGMTLVDGRPVVNIVNGMHSMSLALTGKLKDAELYHHLGTSGQQYNLASIFHQMLPQATNPEVWGTFMLGIGVRFIDEDPKIEGRGTPPWAPWARPFSSVWLGTEEEPSTAYFQQAHGFAEFYKGRDDFSLEYTWNPYPQIIGQMMGG